MHSNINNLLLYEEIDKIAVLTLNRPKQQNALSSDLMKAILNRLDKIENNKTIRAVTIFSSGNNFCAGHDLKELKIDKNEDFELEKYTAKMLFNINKNLENFQYNIVIANFYDTYNNYTNFLESEKISSECLRKNFE